MQYDSTFKTNFILFYLCLLVLVTEFNTTSIRICEKTLESISQKNQLWVRRIPFFYSF